MRKFNITLMLCIAAITAGLGIFFPLAETRGIEYWATNTASLLAITGISLTYATRLIKTNVKSAKAQTVISISYFATLIAAAIIGGCAGSIPYIMQSMDIDFITAFKYIWPTLLLGGAILTISSVFAYTLINRKNIHQQQV
ncbi:MAG: hypothetical protein WA173_06795 [Pseudomonas sp.]|uniref:hypothetical protein n=1 Tax=Pseudomonas sp. TaxID=306 RepID=UPI003BB50438